MKKKLSLFLAFIILFTSFASLLSLLVNFDFVVYADDVETIEELKIAFTDEELLNLGFVVNSNYTSSIYFERTKKTLYQLSINNTIDFDELIILGDNTTYPNYFYYPFMFFPRSLMYTSSDDNYNYYSNFSGGSSFYDLQNFVCELRDDTNLSSFDFTCPVSYINQYSLIFTIAIPKSDYGLGDIKYNRINYDTYVNNGFENPFSDIINYQSYTVDSFYRCNDNLLEKPDLDYIPNYNLWGIRIRSDEEMESLKLGFLDWFEQNNKIDYLIANGLDLTNQYISDIYDWWVEYGASFPSIVVGLPKLISKVNIISWDVSLAKKLVDCFEQLYLEYKTYLENLRYGELTDIHPDSMPHWRDDKTDYTHTTDTEDDTTVIIILREILRNIIVLPESIRTSFSNIDIFFDGIFVNFNNLLYYVNNLPTYIANEIKTIFNGFGFVDVDFNISDLIGDIRLEISDLLNDINVSIENTVEESNENLKELFVPTSEPFSELKEEICLKLPVLNQLSELPNFDGYIEDSENNSPETVSLSAVDTVASSNDKTLSMFNVSFYDNSAYNGVSFDIVDFTKWQKAIDAFKGICSVVIVFHFVHWLIAFIPKLLSGYNSSN